MIHWNDLFLFTNHCVTELSVLAEVPSIHNPGLGFLQGMGRLSVLMRDAGSVMPRRGDIAAWLLAVL